MPDKKRLFLVDGMSNIFRAFYAIRGLSNSKGMPTNAIYGFTVMLRRLVTVYKPDYLGVALDTIEPTFRHEQFADYKAHRPDMPTDLVSQLPYMDRVCEALRVPMIKLPRYEADDIMGTLAHKAVAAGLQAVIVTNDKDLCQLVRDPDISILRVDNKLGEIFLDEAGVKAKLGVRPDQVVDWLGLMGDAVDGIPGAPGIGEKGAIGLLEQFNHIEDALAGWEQVKRKTYRESLRDNAEQIRMSRELARVEVNAPIELDLAALELEPPDAATAYALFSELEFGQLTREFAAGAQAAGQALTVDGAAKAKEAEARYNRFHTIEQLRKFVKVLYNADRFAFALHEEKVEPGKPQLAGVAFSLAPNTADYFDLAACEDRAGAVKLLGEAFENGLIEKVTHDWKRALHLFAPLGITPEAVNDDTLLQAYLLDPERAKYDLADLLLHHGSGHVALNAELPTAQAADLTGRMCDLLNAKIEAEKLEKVYREIDLPVVPILYDIERAGFRVDTSVLKDIAQFMDVELERLSRQIYQLAGREFNIGSPAQLGDIFEELNFEVSQRTKTGKISTSRDVLDELAEKYELPRLVIEHREILKLKGTYVDALPLLIDPTNGRVHTTLNQTIAATGRLSSTDPNLQNIPIRTELGRRIRRAFIPANGCVLLSADYSQIELRLLAHVTGDPVMLEAFRTGEDIHTRTAKAVFKAKTPEEVKEKRRVAKIVNFGIAYVIGAFGLAQRVGISRIEAKKVIEDYYATYKGVKRFMDEFPEQARQENNIVRSIYGRLRRLPDLSNRNGNLRARAEREAINMPMQGSASDIVKLAMIQTAEALRRAKLAARMILQVHDELVFEVPEAEVEQTSAVVKAAMEGAAELAVPLVVEIGVGKNWMDAKP
jgi:DNA polymerase I